MNSKIGAHWHQSSYRQFLNQGLRQLLATRLPLTGLQVDSQETYTCRVQLFLSTNQGQQTVFYSNVLQPDAKGIFNIDGEERVVVPITYQEDLSQATINCVGEQLYQDFKTRLDGQPALPWTGSALSTVLPLTDWIRQFLLISPTAHILQDTNWLDRQTHLRRLRVEWKHQVLPDTHLGRVCPYETPEGPSVGRIVSLAVGAEIRDQKIVIVDQRPEAMLGLSTSLVPFIEHNDPNRQLMGANMMRQFIPISHPEPALVQAGQTFQDPRFWCGLNLLTAYISWGAHTFEDAIIVSQSCARRLGDPEPAEPGDKMANRHGIKGCISRVLPDDEMPHLSDGTPIELIFSPFGIQTRMNLGQLREAVAGRLAKAEGRPRRVNPFQAPGIEEIQDQLEQAGLPPDGMEYLTDGKDGRRLDRPSTVGWVYWGRLIHLARTKIQSTVDGQTPGSQALRNPEYKLLRNLGAYHNLRERFNFCSVDREDRQELLQRVMAGTVEQMEGLSPQYNRLKKHLALAGIEVEYADQQATFGFDRPNGQVLKLARPVPHPWFGSRLMDEVGLPVIAGGTTDDLLPSGTVPSQHDGSW